MILWPLAVTLCLGGCGDVQEPAAPSVATPPPSLAVTSTGTCVRVTFQITSATAATGTYPSNSCTPAGLNIQTGGTVTWNGTTRTLSLPVRIRNTTTQSVELPIRLELPTSGKQVLAPTGTPATALVPLNMDSTLAADKKVWLIGGAGVLAPGGVSAATSLTFRVNLPATKGRFTLTSIGQDVVPKPTIPTVTQWPTPELTVVSGSNPNYEEWRNVYAVIFAETATGQTISQFLQRFGGTVIGGNRLWATDPTYYILVADPGPSWAAVDSLGTVMSGAPGVVTAAALTSTGRIRLRGRYPVDNAPRQTWFGGANSALQPWLAIRAPFAWGCETGDYSPANPVRVGVIDQLMDGIPPDLSASLTAARIFPAGNRHQVVAPEVGDVTHGQRVAGLISATGDNGVGIAGMAWRTQMYVWPTGTFVGGQYEEARRDVDVVDAAVTGAISNSVKVLNISAGLGNIKNSSDVYDVLASLKRYLDSGADRLLVVASGNDTLTMGLGLLAVSRDPRLFATDHAVAALAQVASYASRVIFVTATNRQGTRWIPANAYTGVSMVAAPGEGITALDGTAGSVGVFSGTSFAAPMVTGLASLLWSMIPTLTAAEVKDYIVRGAIEPRVDSVTGAAITPTDIGVAGVYQIDAYSSLKLASKERVGSPICGNEIGFNNNGDLVLFRNGAQTEQIAPTGSVVWQLTVAQGGRLVAGTDGSGPDPMVRTYKLVNGAWQPGQVWPAGTYGLQYLEKDTAIVRLQTLGTYQNGGPLSLTISGPSGSSVQNLDLGVRISAPNTIFRQIGVSPDARWVGFMSLRSGGQYYYADSSAGSQLVTLRSAPAPANPDCSQIFGLVFPGTTCTDAPVIGDTPRFHWAPDSRWVTVMQWTHSVVCPLGGMSCPLINQTTAIRFSVPTRATIQVANDGFFAHQEVLSGDGATWRECRIFYFAGVRDDSTAYRSATSLETFSSTPGCILSRPTVQNAPIAL